MFCVEQRSDGTWIVVLLTATREFPPGTVLGPWKTRREACAYARRMH